MTTAKLPEDQYWHALVPPNAILCSGEMTMVAEVIGKTITLMGMGYYINGRGTVTCPECIKKLSNAVDREFQNVGIEVK